MKEILKRKAVMILFAGGIILAGLLMVKSGSDQQSLHSVHAELYYCPMHPTYTSDKSGDCPICSMKLIPLEKGGESGLPRGLKEFTVDEIMNMKPGEICLLHKCSHGKCLITMTEEIARLGKCPHCGEDLGVVIKEALPEGYGSVSLSQAKQQVIGVKTVAVVKSKMKQIIRTVGTVAHDPELYQAQAEYLEALRSFRKAEEGKVSELVGQAKRLVDSAKLRLQYMGFGDELIQEIEVENKPDSSLLFERSGGKVWGYAKIYEYELPYVRKGQDIFIEIPSHPGRTFKGVVRSIDPTVDPGTRTTRVRAQFEDSESLLRPDMYVNVRIEVDLGEVVTIPKEAVFDTGTRKIVFVEKESGIFDPREVTVGAESERNFEVKGGLSEGEKVVTSGNFLIDSESRLRASFENLSGGHKHGS